MATTPKLGLKKPTEADYFDINDFNANMDKIDVLVHMSKSGSTKANRYAVNSPTSVVDTVTWYWRKYDDGHFTAYTYFEDNNLRCNDDYGEAGTWCTGYVKVDYPAIGIKSIGNVQLTCRMNTRLNWAVEASSASDIAFGMVRLVGMSNEGVTERIAKRIFFQIDGEWQ